MTLETFMAPIFFLFDQFGLIFSGANGCFICFLEKSFMSHSHVQPPPPKMALLVIVIFSLAQLDLPWGLKMHKVVQLIEL